MGGNRELNRMKSVLLALFLLAFPRLAAAQAYTVTDLGNLDPVAINNAGQIVGGNTLWTNGKSVPLVGIDPTALNNRGQVIGADGGPHAIHGSVAHNVHALLWQNGRLIDLGTPGMPSQYEATGINDSDQIIGTSYRHPLLWENGRRTYLPKLFKDPPYTQMPCGTGGINNRGQSVGYAATNNGDTHAVLWQNGRILDLGGSSGHEARAVAINDHSQIVGYASLKQFQYRHAMLWQGGKRYDLKTLPGDTDSRAAAINNRGQIVGNSEKIIYVPSLRGFPARAFFWQNGKMSNLNAFLPSHSGWHLERAQGINDRGQIIGDGTYNGRPHGFLLTPQS